MCCWFVCVVVCLWLGGGEREALVLVRHIYRRHASIVPVMAKVRRGRCAYVLCLSRFQPAWLPQLLPSSAPPSSLTTAPPPPHNLTLPAHSTPLKPQTQKQQGVSELKRDLSEQQC